MICHASTVLSTDIYSAQIRGMRGWRGRWGISFPSPLPLLLVSLNEALWRLIAYPSNG